jgi:hypothetical protein
MEKRRELLAEQPHLTTPEVGRYCRKRRFFLLNKQGCGSGSGMWCFFDPRIQDLSPNENLF